MVGSSMVVLLFRVAGNAFPATYASCDLRQKRPDRWSERDSMLSFVRSYRSSVAFEPCHLNADHCSTPSIKWQVDYALCVSSPNPISSATIYSGRRLTSS